MKNPELATLSSNQSLALKLAAAALTTLALVNCLPARAAEVPGYTFTEIATLGVSPNFGDFEPGQINSHGDSIFVSETAVCLDSIFGPQTLCEGVFLVNHDGEMSQILAPGDALPRGGNYSGFILGQTAVNDSGDAAIAVILQPVALPLGTNGGVYRYSRDTRSLTAVVVPGVTEVPGGGGSKFQGAGFAVNINHDGDIALQGVIASSHGLPGKGLGQGVFVADHDGKISAIVLPGDPVPGGGAFDFAANGSINDEGDVAFEAHLAGAECIEGDPSALGCFATGVYLRKSGDGSIISIAKQGDLDPLGATFRHTWGPLVNNSGRVLFVGDLTPAPNDSQAQGLYLYHDHVTSPVARPGDALPGGGAFKTLNGENSLVVGLGGHDLNNRGDISFSATLDNGDQGLYVKQHGGGLQLVAKTGTSLPGIGVVGSIVAGGVNNNRGQILFDVTLASGETVLVVATPKPGQDSPAQR